MHVISLCYYPHTHCTKNKMHHNNETEINKTIPYHIFSLFFRILAISLCSIMCFKLSSSWLRLSLRQSIWYLQNKNKSPWRKLSLLISILLLTPIAGMSVIGICLMSTGWAYAEKEMYSTGLGLLIVGYMLITLRSIDRSRYSYHSDILFHAMIFSTFLFISGISFSI